MEIATKDKWFIYYENGWLHIHRSWTGFEIFKLNIEYVNEDKYHIDKLFIEKEFDNLVKNENNESDLTYITSLIKTLIS